jgi:simple sugar transport system ATP-binding protein
MTSPPVLLSIRGIEKLFGATRALAGIDLDLRQGEIMALMGANGAGKSTLVNILSGTYAPDGGSLTIAGQSYRPESPRDAVAAGIVTVHQATALAGVPGLTVADALVLDRFADGRAPFLLSRRSVRRQAAEVAARAGFSLPLDADFADIGPATRQLVGIARALAHDARILILDEPTASLSSEESRQLFDVLESLRQRDLSIIYISHRTADLARLADRAVVLRGGRVAGVFERPVDLDAAIGAMIGRPLAAAHVHAREISGEVAFELSQVRLLPTSAPIELTLRRGEVVAITGPLGAGKSRLLKAIFGVAPVAGGSMRLDGAAYAPRSPTEAIREGVALAGEDRHQSSFVPSDWPGGTVAGTIALPYLARWFPRFLLTGGRDIRAAEQAIARLAIAASGPRARLDTLSGGNQQKVVLGRWQAEPSRLLLLDEPFQGVDVGARADIIAALRSARDVAVLIATSDPEEALEAADRIFRMDRHALIPWRPGISDAA